MRDLKNFCECLYATVIEVATTAAAVETVQETLAAAAITTVTAAQSDVRTAAMTSEKRAQDALRCDNLWPLKKTAVKIAGRSRSVWFQVNGLNMEMYIHMNRFHTHTLVLWCSHCNSNTIVISIDQSHLFPHTSRPPQYRGAGGTGGSSQGFYPLEKVHTLLKTSLWPAQFLKCTL